MLEIKRRRIVSIKIIFFFPSVLVKKKEIQLILFIDIKKTRKWNNYDSFKRLFWT
jgi:hypothetical protein